MDRTPRLPIKRQRQQERRPPTSAECGDSSWHAEALLGRREVLSSRCPPCLRTTLPPAILPHKTPEVSLRRPGSLSRGTDPLQLPRTGLPLDPGIHVPRSQPSGDRLAARGPVGGS